VSLHQLHSSRTSSCIQFHCMPCRDIWSWLLLIRTTTKSKCSYQGTLTENKNSRKMSKPEKPPSWKQGSWFSVSSQDFAPVERGLGETDAKWHEQPGDRTSRGVHIWLSDKAEKESSEGFLDRKEPEKTFPLILFCSHKTLLIGYYSYIQQIHISIAKT
jgi:hypothetical protein